MVLKRSCPAVSLQEGEEEEEKKKNEDEEGNSMLG